VNREIDAGGATRSGGVLRIQHQNRETIVMRRDGANDDREMKPKEISRARRQVKVGENYSVCECEIIRMDVFGSRH
jgi:hypothetical protein